MLFPLVFLITIGVSTLAASKPPDDAEYAEKDLNRDLLPWLEGSLPGDCPEGSTCRMIYVTFVVPKMKRYINDTYNFDYGIIQCSALIAEKGVFELDGTTARLTLDTTLDDNSYVPLPGQIMKCLESLMLSETAIMFSQPFTGLYQQSYAARRSIRRLLATSDKFQIYHQTVKNLRQFKAYLEIYFPRPKLSKPSLDCCRSVLWYVGYGLVTYMEECQLGCTKGRPWGEDLKITEAHKSPLHHWKEFTPNEMFEPWNPDAQFSSYNSRREYPEDIFESKVPLINNSELAGDDTKAGGVKNGENGNASSSTPTEDFSTPFYYLLSLYAVLIVFAFILLIALCLIYFDKKKKLRKQEALNEKLSKKKSDTNAKDGDEALAAAAPDSDQDGKLSRRDNNKNDQNQGDSKPKRPSKDKNVRKDKSKQP